MDYQSAKQRVIMRKISYPGLFPVSDLNGSMTGAKVSFSASASVKCSASWEYVGDDLESGDVVQLACSFADGTETEEVVIATLKCYFSEATEKAKIKNLKVDAYGLLKIASEAAYWSAYSVRAGTDAFTAIEDVLGSVGLRLAYRPDESHPVRIDKTYFPEDFTKLDIVNDLLNSAGYLSADTDELGRVVFRQQVPTPTWAPVWLEEGTTSIIDPESIIERDWSGIHNVIIGVVDTPDSEVMRAVAVNDDPTDPTSTVARGEVARVERFNDIESASVLSIKVASLLAEERSRLEAVRVKIGYAPLRLFGAVGVKKGSLDQVYTVVSMDLEIEGMSLDIRARRYL